MDSTEPTLVPEWLRSTGNVGGSASVHHSDASAHSIRSRSLSGNSEKDSPRHLNRSSLSNPRHSSNSNGSGKHPYSSFSRSHWDKNRDREKERSLSEWNHNSSDPLTSLLTSRVERGGLRRSQSLVSKKPAEPLSHRLENSRISGNGVVSRGSNLNVSQKAVFEKDFPSLGNEEKQCATGIRRVSSPGLSSAVQCLPIGNTGFLGGEKWTSALAEVPDILANNGISHSTIQQGVVTSSGISSSAGLNMAEALSQPVARVHPSSQLSDKSQRLEELAIKQSRQLIPMTSSMPKPLVPSSDKSKQPKIATRANEITVASKSIHPQPHASHLANQSRTGQVRSDSASASHVGKFLVLKPGRENGSTTGDEKGEVANNGQVAMAPSTPTGSITPTNSMVSALENKAAALSLSSRSTTDKKSLQSLAQSRSEFFNLMRRKTSQCATTTVRSGSGAAVLSPGADASRENCNANQMNCNGERCEIPEKTRSSFDVEDKSFSVNGSIYPDEEEAAFLRSLGWEENGGEDEALTEEEINAFYQEYMSRRPSSEVCRSSQLKYTTPCIASSESCSSKSDPEL